MIKAVRIEFISCIGNKANVVLHSLNSFLILCILSPFSWSAVPTRYDTFFHQVAVDFSAADICSKISPDAIRYDSGWSGPNPGPYFERSECFYDIALKTHDATLCNEVKKVHFWSSGGGFTKKACLRDLGGPRGYVDTFYCTPNDIDQMLAMLGIDGCGNPVGSASSCYLRLKLNHNDQKTVDFLRRVRALSQKDRH
jgi:hypothetical protein